MVQNLVVVVATAAVLVPDSGKQWLPSTFAYSALSPLSLLSVVSKAAGVVSTVGVAAADEVSSLKEAAAFVLLFLWPAPVACDLRPRRYAFSSTDSCRGRYNSREGPMANDLAIRQRKVTHLVSAVHTPVRYSEN